MICCVVGVVENRIFCLSDDLLGTTIDVVWCTRSCVAECSTGLVDHEHVGVGRVAWLGEHGEVGIHLLVADFAVGLGVGWPSCSCECTAIGCATSQGTGEGGGIVGWDTGGTMWPEVAWTQLGVIVVIWTSDATGSADGNTEWKELSSSISPLLSKTLVLSGSTMSSHEVVVFQAGSETSSGGIVVGVISVLGWESKTTSNTIEDGDGTSSLGESGTTGGFLVVVVLELWVQSDWRNGGHLWVVHHLGATGSDTDDLSEVGSFFDGAEKFFTDALNWVEMGKVTIL